METDICKTDQSSTSLEMGPTFYCPTCQLPFNGRDTLKMHMAMHRNLAETLDHLENQCPTCGNFFNSRDTLNMHMEDHRISYGNTYLNESLNMDTSDSFEQTFYCRLCQSIFHSKEKLRMHADEHKFTQKCNQCNIAFKSEKNLMKHKRMCITTKMNEINDNNWVEMRKGMKDMMREVTGMEEMMKEVAKDMYVMEEREMMMDRSKMRKRGSRGGQWKKVFGVAGMNVAKEAIERTSGQ